MDINNFRRRHLAIAEMIDAWRIIPRVLIIGYVYLMYHIVMWYMTLPEPSTQHTAFVSAVIGVGTAIFGLYTGTGKKWDAPFVNWPATPKVKQESKTEQSTPKITK